MEHLNYGRKSKPEYPTYEARMLILMHARGRFFTQGGSNSLSPLVLWPSLSEDLSVGLKFGFDAVLKPYKLPKFILSETILITTTMILIGFVGSAARDAQNDDEEVLARLHITINKEAPIFWSFRRILDGISASQLQVDPDGSLRLWEEVAMTIGTTPPYMETFHGRQLPPGR